MSLVSWQEVVPPVTAVVRCDPVVRGPDVAPAVPSLEGASGPVVPAWLYADAAGYSLLGSTVVDRE
jgi:hypothetical protein